MYNCVNHEKCSLLCNLLILLSKLVREYKRDLLDEPDWDETETSLLTSRDNAFNVCLHRDKQTLNELLEKRPAKTSV